MNFDGNFDKKLTRVKFLQCNTNSLDIFLKFRQLEVTSDQSRFEKTTNFYEQSQNEYLDAKIGVDTVENEPSKDL